MAIDDYSTTPGSNNGAPPNGAPEGMQASTVNDVIRQVMADVRAWYEDAQWIDYGHTPTRVDGDTFTVATDLTTIYQAGRRLKMTGSATAYGTILSSSYSAPNTTVDISSSAIPATLTTVSVGILSGSNSALPADGSATFTATGTGFTVNPTVTAIYTKNGNLVTLYMPLISGTSNSTSFSITGLPAAITPARNQTFPVPVIRDNGGDGNSGAISITSAGTMIVEVAGGISSIVTWTNSGTKACGTFTVTYTLA